MAAVFVMVVGFLVRNLADDLYLDTPLNLFWFLLGASYPLLPQAGRVGAGDARARSASERFETAEEGLRVLYVFAALPVGGAEKLLYAELKHLDSRRFRPMVCSLRDKGPMGERIEELGVPVVALHRMRSNWIDLKMIRMLKDLMVRERIQLVHTHLHDGGRYGRLAARWAGVPCTVATFHNVYVRPRWKHHLINAVLCRWTDRIVAVSRAVKADLIRFDRVPPDRIRVIYNTIDLERFRGNGDGRALRREYGWETGHLVMGCVARLEEQKGHIYLIRALARLVPSHPALRLLLVGDGRLRSVLEEEVRALRLERYVRFAGTSERVPELLRMLDLFVLPSLWEGLPLVLGEAMAAGVPVICTDVGGVGEIVIPGETGILIPPARVEAIEQAVKWCLKDLERTRVMAEKARVRVERFFSPEAHMRRLEELYEEVLKAKGIRVPSSRRVSALP